jgi:hypothetical protein
MTGKLETARTAEKLFSCQSGFTRKPAQGGVDRKGRESSECYEGRRMSLSFLS